MSVRYACVTSAVRARSFAFTWYIASSRAASATCTRSSRWKLSKMGTDSEAVSAKGERLKRNGNWLFASRIDCACASVKVYCGPLHPTALSPEPTRIESDVMQLAYEDSAPARARFTR